MVVNFYNEPTLNDCLKPIFVADPLTYPVERCKYTGRYTLVFSMHISFLTKHANLLTLNTLSLLNTRAIANGFIEPEKVQRRASICVYVLLNS